MFEKVKYLRDQFRQATTQEQEAEIQKQLDKLKSQNPKQWAEAMLECMKNTQEEAKELREKIEKENGEHY